MLNATIENLSIVVFLFNYLFIGVCSNHWRKKRDFYIFFTKHLNFHIYKKENHMSVELDIIKHLDPNYPIAESNDVKGSHYIVDNITELFAVPINKRQNVIITVKHYDELLQGSTTAEQCLIWYMGSDFTDVNWENLTNWKDLSTDPIISSEIISKTYDELAALQTSNELITGQKYLLNNYRTFWQQLQTGTEFQGDIEPLIITASSSNTFFHSALSLIYSSDIIDFDFDYSYRDHPNAKGLILHRIIENAISTPFDSRAIKFRRYAPTPNTWAVGTTYSLNDWVVKNSKYYISKVDSNIGVDPETINVNWYHIQEIDVFKYVLYEPNQFSWIPCDGTDFVDIPIIHKIGETIGDMSYLSDDVLKGNVRNVNVCETNNVLIYSGQCSEINIPTNNENNTISDVNSTVLHGLNLYNVTNTSFVGNVTESLVYDVSNTFINGLFRSTIKGYINNGILLSDVTYTPSIKNVIYSSSIDSIIFKSYNQLVDCNLLNFCDVTIYGKLTNVNAFNWKDVVIPSNIEFIDCSFDIQKWEGLNVWGGVAHEYISCNINKYYVDSLISPTIEKLWYENVHVDSSVTLVEVV